MLPITEISDVVSKFSLEKELSEQLSENIIPVSSSVNQSKSVQKNNTIDLNKINKNPLGTVFRNQTDLPRGTADKQQKTYSCPFCKKILKEKISEHIFRVHKKEPIVQKIKSLPSSTRKKGELLNPQQMERLHLLSLLRNEGAFARNCAANDVRDVQLPRRLRENSNIRTIQDLRACSYCFGHFGAKSIHKHLKRCKGDSNRNTDINVLNNLALGDIHFEANIYLRIVASRLRKDKVSTIIRYDLLIILFGNSQAYKHRKSNTITNK